MTDLTRHHLIPRSEGGAGGETIGVCRECHKALHALYDNSTLASSLNTLAALRRDARVRRHVRWLSRRDPDRSFRMSRSKTNRRRRR